MQDSNKETNPDLMKTSLGKVRPKNVRRKFLDHFLHQIDESLLLSWMIMSKAGVKEFKYSDIG